MIIVQQIKNENLFATLKKKTSTNSVSGVQEIAVECNFQYSLIKMRCHICMLNLFIPLVHMGTWSTDIDQGGHW